MELNKCIKKSFPGAQQPVLYYGYRCRGRCNANEKNMYVYTNLNEKSIFLLFFIHTTFQIAFIGLLEKYLFESEYPCHAIVSWPSIGGFWAKFARNTDQGGRLKTICPEILFDIVTGGCIFNRYKVFLCYLSYGS